jgi:hypothetical protein
MRWLDRKRKNLIDKYRTELKTTTLSDVMLESPTVYQNKAATFVFEPTQQTEEVQFFPIDKFKLRVAILDVEIHPQPTDFDLVLHSADLFSDERIKVTPIALREFPLAIHRFTFQKTRQEQTLFSPKPPIVTGPYGPPIPIKPPRPPAPPSTISLEERLRWILTPPN